MKKFLLIFLLFPFLSMGECPTNMPMSVLNKFQIIQGTAEFLTEDFEACQSCDSLEIWATRKSECDKCSNREYKDGYCYFKENGCPESLIWHKGFCIEKKNCAENEIYAFVLGYKDNNWKTIVSALDGTTGECVSCFDKRDIQITKKECDLCPDRSFHDGWCVLVEE